MQKRQQPAGLRAGQQQPAKAQRPAGGRPVRGSSGPLVPPQLRGRFVGVYAIDCTRHISTCMIAAFMLQ